MTQTMTFEAHRTWLLACADRLNSEGNNELAAEARAEADAMLSPAVARPTVTHLPCEDCGRPASIRKMPADWLFDWWSHKLNGHPCREAK